MKIRLRGVTHNEQQMQKAEKIGSQKNPLKTSFCQYVKTLMITGSGGE